MFVFYFQEVHYIIRAKSIKSSRAEKSSIDQHGKKFSKRLKISAKLLTCTTSGINTSKSPFSQQQYYAACLMRLLTSPTKRQSAPFNSYLSPKASLHNILLHFEIILWETNNVTCLFSTPCLLSTWFIIVYQDYTWKIFLEQKSLFTVMGSAQRIRVAFEITFFHINCNWTIRLLVWFIISRFIWFNRVDKTLF